LFIFPTTYISPGPSSQESPDVSSSAPLLADQTPPRDVIAAPFRDSSLSLSVEVISRTAVVPGAPPRRNLFIIFREPCFFETHAVVDPLFIAVSYDAG